MNDQPRPVWITEADLAMPLDSAFREIVRAKFKAAPADATEAVANVLDGVHAHGNEAWLTGDLDTAVLRALGHPS